MNEWSKFKQQIIMHQNCMHTGLFQGLYPDLFQTIETEYGPLPHPISSNDIELDKEDLSLGWACESGRGAPLPYLMLYQGYPFKNWLIGSYQNLYIGHAVPDELRKSASSGGIIKTTVIELLKRKKIQACLILKQGISNQPEKAGPVFIEDPQEIMHGTQSIYATTPILSILGEAEKYDGDLGIVALPEQVATLRMLQAAGNKNALKFKWVLGPYTGTNMYPGAIRNFLRANGVSDNLGIQKLEWRAGTWPGYLQITMENEKVYKAEKFYYNYLIPFYISRHSLWVNDFANELTDISVGDAWSPKYEKARYGHSVVAARSVKAREFLNELYEEKIIHINPVQEKEALSMHGHMIDFKKRGSYIRNTLRKNRKMSVPDWGSEPCYVDKKRIRIEKFIFTIFQLCGTLLLRKIVTYIPINIIGPLFNFIRLKWKNASKPSKRKGLSNQSFRLTDMDNRWRELRRQAGVTDKQIENEISEFREKLQEALS